MTATATATTTRTKTLKPSVVVERKDLLQAIQRVKPAAGRPPQRLRVTATARDGLVVSATDLGISVSCFVTADVARKLDVVVTPKTLADLVRMSEGPLQIDEQDDGLRLRWGTTTATLTAHPVGEWPRYDEIEGTVVELAAVDVQRFRQIANFASTDDARPILSAVRIGGATSSNPPGLVATDSYRLAVCRTKTSLKGIEFLLPARVARFLPAVMADDAVAILTVGESRTRIEVDDITVDATLIQGEFPPTKKLLAPVPDHAAVSFDRQQLLRATRTLKILKGAVETPMVLNFQDGAVVVSRTEPELGVVEARVDATVITGQPERIAVHPNYFEDMLATCDTEAVVLQFQSPLKPLVTKEGPWTLLLMPVRVR